MRIKLKTGGLLSDILLPDADEEETDLSVNQDATPNDVLNQLELPQDDFYLIILNDEVVPKAQRDQLKLKQDDVLGIFPPLKGG